MLKKKLVFTSYPFLENCLTYSIVLDIFAAAWKIYDFALFI